MESKGKKQFSNSKDEPGARTHPISWFIVLTHQFHHSLQQQGGTIFTSLPRQRWCAALSPEFGQPFGKPCLKCSHKQEEPFKDWQNRCAAPSLLAWTAVENCRTSPRQILSVTIYQHKTLGIRHLENIQARKNMEGEKVQAVDLVRDAGFGKQSSNYVCQEALMQTKCNLLPYMVYKSINNNNKKKIHFLPVSKGLLNLCLASMYMNIHMLRPELLTCLNR